MHLNEILKHHNQHYDALTKSMPAAIQYGHSNRYDFVTKPRLKAGEIVFGRSFRVIKSLVALNGLSVFGQEILPVSYDPSKKYVLSPY